MPRRTRTAPDIAIGDFTPDQYRDYLNQLVPSPENFIQAMPEWLSPQANLISGEDMPFPAPQSVPQPGRVQTNGFTTSPEGIELSESRLVELQNQVRAHNQEIAVNTPQFESYDPFSISFGTIAAQYYEQPRPSRRSSQHFNLLADENLARACRYCGALESAVNISLTTFWDQNLDFPAKLCQLCLATQCTSCNICTKNIQNNFIQHYKQQKLCYDCLEKIKESCEICKKEFSHRSLMTIQVITNPNTAKEHDKKMHVCRDCEEESFKQCRHCHQTVFAKDGLFCEPHDAFYCKSHKHKTSCIGDCDKRHWSATFVKGDPCELLENDRFIGVELEAEINNEGEYLSTSEIDCVDFGLPKSFGIGFDGSLDNGREITTPPATGTEHVKNVKLACESLLKNDFIITPKCGVHVHIDVRDKRDDYIYLSHLLTTFFAVEDLLFAMQPKSRQQNHYCKWLRDAFSFFDFYKKDYAEDFDYHFYKKDKKEVSRDDLKSDKKSKYHLSRYYGINFHSIFYRGSLEIRMHAGSLNPVKIIRWCQIIQKIFNWVDRNYDFDTVTKLLTMPATTQKIDFAAEVFGFSNPLKTHMRARIRQFSNLGLYHQVILGELPHEYATSADPKTPKNSLLLKILENNKKIAKETMEIKFDHGDALIGCGYIVT